MDASVPLGTSSPSLPGTVTILRRSPLAHHALEMTVAALLPIENETARLQDGDDLPHFHACTLTLACGSTNGKHRLLLVDRSVGDWPVSNSGCVAAFGCGK